ncbi:MAG: hypothetical protein ISS57_04645 [Anaerolineales bacterium]|nr:hypothetical protein [Anaerolineales bacterium]
MPKISDTHSESNTVLRFLVLGIWSIVLALGVWLGSIYFSEDGQVTPTAPIEITIVSPTSLPDQPTKTSHPPPISPTPVPSMATRTPIITPTDYPRPSSTRQSSAEQGLGLSVRPRVIGYSVNGLPLEVFTFGTGSTERMIVAGIHGGYEWNTVALADELIKYLDQHPEIVPSHIKLHILRSFNPDGEARSHGYEGRANSNGVDLNRNFPTLWQADWPRYGCWDYGPINAGSQAGSEPETIALMNFIQNHHIDALINYHSAALGIFPGGQPPEARSVNLAEIIASISNYPYPPIDTDCQFTGQLIDWASVQGIAAVDIELTDHENTDFDQNLLILVRFLLWQP